MRVIAVANCKGGTGKTTTTVNLAAALAEQGRRTLVVDLDAQGHAGLGFEVFATQSHLTAHHVFRQADADIGAAICSTCMEGVDLLPADPDFRIHASEDDPFRLARALAAVESRYDVAVIDTPPSADLPLIAALVAANFVLVPTQLNHLAHHGLTQLARLVFRVGTTLNSGLQALAIVPVQLDMRTNIQQKILAKLMYDYGPERIFHGIRTDVSLAEAFGSHRPIKIYRPAARGAVDYGLLAKDVNAFWIH